MNVFRKILPPILIVLLPMAMLYTLWLNPTSAGEDDVVYFFPLHKLVGQEIQCRIIKLDVADEDVVVDRRAVLEDEEKVAKERLFSEVKEGETLEGTVRTLTDYGAFVDIGGVDGLLHVADISWGRVNKPADALTVGQRIQTKVLTPSSWIRAEFTLAETLRI